MSQRKSQITAELKLAGMQKFKSGLAEVGKDAKKTGGEIAKIGSGQGFGSSTRFTELHSGLRLLTGAGRSAFGAVKSVFSAAANEEALIRSLTATSDGVRTVEAQFNRLRDRATENGVEVNAMADAFVQLRSAALSSDEAEKTASSVANALQRIGKSGDFGAVMTNLVQISSRTSGLGDEIKELGNYLPEVRKLSKMRFGTDTGEGLNSKGITGREWVIGMSEEFSKYQKAAGGARAATAGFASQWESTKATLGSLFDDKAAAALNTVSQALGGFNEQIKAEFGGPGVMTGAEQAAKRSEAAKELVVLEEKRAEQAREYFSKQMDIANAENAISKARAANDDAGILAATTELTILREKLALMRDAGATNEEAVEFLQRRVALEQQSANIARDAERSKRRAAEGRNLMELEAKAGGMSSRRFKKLEKSNNLADETDRLVADGVPLPEAKKLAERKVNAEERIFEDEERASRGLRPRIRSVTGDQASRNRFNRLSAPDKRRLEGLSHNEDAMTTFARKQRGGLEGYADDALPMRPRESRLAARAPEVAQPRGSRGASPNQSPSSGGIGEQIGKEIVRKLDEVKSAIDRNGPSRNDRARPISSTKF